MNNRSNINIQPRIKSSSLANTLFNKKNDIKTHLREDKQDIDYNDLPETVIDVDDDDYEPKSKSNKINWGLIFCIVLVIILIIVIIYCIYKMRDKQDELNGFYKYFNRLNAQKQKYYQQNVSKNDQKSTQKSTQKLPPIPEMEVLQQKINETNIQRKNILDIEEQKLKVNRSDNINENNNITDNKNANNANNTNNDKIVNEDDNENNDVDSNNDGSENENNDVNN